MELSINDPSTMLVFLGSVCIILTCVQIYTDRWILKVIKGKEKDFIIFGILLISLGIGMYLYTSWSTTQPSVIVVNNNNDMNMKVYR